jgi:hypothetical protein
MLKLIKEAWGWIGFSDPEEVMAQNEFGNVIFRDSEKRFWRICPEELSCETVAGSQLEYAQLWEKEDFLRDWQMGPLVEVALAKYGAQPEGRCFCLKMPAMFGGTYEVDNFGTITILELISFTGDAAKQIKDLPARTKIRFRFI